jgi:autotransporter-associated beta strand protein
MDILVRRYVVLIVSLVIIVCVNNIYSQVTQVGSAETAYTNTGTITINKPTGVADGDLLLAYICQKHNGAGSVADASLAGWTVVKSYKDSYNKSTLLYKVASSEGSDYTFTLNNTSYNTGTVLAFTNVDVSGGLDELGSASSGPFDNTIGTFSGPGTSGSSTASTITTLNDNSVVLMFTGTAYDAATYSSSSTTSPGALTELIDYGQAASGDWSSLCVSWGTKTTAGATGSGSVTLTGGGSYSYSASLLISLKEACGGDTPTATSDSPLCNTSVTITATGSPSANNTWYWQTTSSGTSTTDNATTPYTAASSGTYYIRSYYSVDACWSTASSIAVTVDANPTTSAAGSDITIPTCASVTLGANTPSVGTGAWTVTSGPSTSTAQFASTSDPNTVFTPAGGAGSYVLRWTISNGSCTSSTDELTVTVSGASYSGTLTVGVSGCHFTSLTDALTKLGSCGYTGNIILELQTNFDGTSSTETFPLDFASSSVTPGSSTTITIRPASGVGSALSITGSHANYIIYMNGTDYVTFDGRPGGAGSNKYLTIENTSTTGDCAVKLIADASNNTFKYCTLKALDDAATNAGIVWISTATTSGNDDNTFDYCVFDGGCGATASPSSGVAKNGIYSYGTTAKTNSSITVSNCEFKDVWSVDASASSVFVNLDAYNDSWTITGNSFYQTNTRTATGAQSFYGVKIDDGSGYTISSNYFGGSAAACSGTWTQNSTSTNYTKLYAFYLNVGTASVSSVQGNVIKNLTWDIKGANDWSVIYVSSGDVNIGTTSANTIGATTGTGSITLVNTSGTPNIYGIYSSSTGTVDIQNNTIGSIATSAASGISYNFYGIYTGSSGAVTISSNYIGSSSTSNSITFGDGSTTSGVNSFYGIYNTSSGSITISSNTVKNCSVYGTSTSKIYGIYNDDGAATISITSNTITYCGNLSTGSSTSAYSVGIYQAKNVTNNISSNTINTFTVNNGIFRGVWCINNGGSTTISSNSIGTSTVGNITISSTGSNNNTTVNNCGIYIYSSFSTATTYDITSNSISGITVSGAATEYLFGLYVINSSYPVINCSKNTFDKLLITNNSSTSSYLYGIYSLSSSATATYFKQNIVRNLANANTSGTRVLTGVYVKSYNRNFYNNLFSIKNSTDDGVTPYTNAITIKTIDFVTSASSHTNTFYYNTFEVGGSQGSGSDASYCFYQNTATAGMTNTFQNNIFQNTRTGSTGVQYCYFATSQTSVNNLDYNFYCAPDASNFASVANSAISSATFNSASADYGGTTSTVYTTTAITINSDGSLSGADITTVGTGADLDAISGCEIDINDLARDASGGVKGCYEGAAASVFYSQSASADPTNVANWNSVRGGGGSAPSNFTTAGQTFVIQSGHDYQMSTTWTGEATSIIQVESGGALDINAQSLATWLRIDIAGTGVASSGAIHNSGGAVGVSIPITLTAASTVTNSGSGTLTLTGNIDNGGFDLTVNGTNNTTISTGVLSGAGSLIKDGSGTLTLSGSNTYTGTTTISNGTLSAGSIVVSGGASNIGNAASAVVLGDGSNTGVLSYTGSAATYVRGFTVNAGGGTLTNTTVNLLTVSTAGITNGGVLTFSNTSSGNTSVSSVISSTGSVLVNNSGSGITVLSGSNSYTGTTTISAGTLQLGATGDATNTPLGTTGGTTIVSSGGCLDLAGYTLGTAEAITISGTGVSSSGAVMNSGGSCTYSGLVTLGANASILGGSGTIALSNVGTISGATYTLTLGGAQGGSIASIIGTTSGGITKQDAGTWTLTGANTFTGAVAVNAGVLNLQNNTAAGTTAGGVTVASGAALELQGGITVGAEALSLNNDGVSSAGSLRNISGSNIWGGAITLSTNAVRINSDAGTLTLSSTITNGAIDLTIGGAGDIVASGVIGNGAGALTKDGAGQLTLGATNTYSGITTLTAGTLLLGAAQTSLTNNIVLTAGTLNAAGYAITSSGSWTNNGSTFTHGNNTVTLTGTGKTIGGSSSSTFYNLTLSGASTYTLGASQTVNNTFTFAGGSILTLSTNDLTIGSSGAFSGYDASNFVVTNSTGKVTQNGIQTGSAAGKKIFPIGYTSSTFTPLVLNNIGTSDNFSAYIGNNRLASGTSGAAATENCVDRTWFIEEAVAGASDVDVKFYWHSSLELTNFDRTNAYIGHYTGGAWSSDTPSSSTDESATYGAGYYSMTRSSISSFSPFDTEDPEALPIDLIQFAAKQEGSKVRIDWTTASEENNDYFTLERSKDGVEFQELFRKEGAGVSTTFLYYFGYDNAPRVGVNYYRLKQTDFDGKYEYSQIESVDFKENSEITSFKVYPNPSLSKQVTLDFEAKYKGTFTIDVYDAIGTLVDQKEVQFNKGINTIKLSYPELSNGLYLLRLTRFDGTIVGQEKVKF